mgnify:CR=1 FL=1
MSGPVTVPQNRLRRQTTGTKTPLKARIPPIINTSRPLTRCRPFSP